MEVKYLWHGKLNEKITKCPNKPCTDVAASHSSLSNESYKIYFHGKQMMSPPLLHNSETFVQAPSSPMG
jgi:hypothetical protein